AEKEIKRALELNPKFQEAHYINSFFLLTRARFDEAIDEARSAVELDPFAPRLLNHLGLSYFLARRFDEAVTAFKQAVELDPGNPLLRDVLGDALLCTGAHAEAVAEWKMAFQCVGDAGGAEQLSSTFAEAGFERALLVRAQLKLQQLVGRRERGEYVPE